MSNSRKIQLEEGLGHARALEKQLLDMETHMQKVRAILESVQQDGASFLHSFEGPAYLKSRLQRFVAISKKLQQQQKQDSVLHGALRRQLEKFLDPDLLMYYSPSVSRRLEAAFGDASPRLKAPGPSEHRCYRLGHFYYVTRAEPCERIGAARLRKTGKKLPRRVILPGSGPIQLFPGHPEQYHADGPSAIVILQGTKKIGLWIDEELAPLDIGPYMDEMEVSRRAPYPVAGRFRKRGQQHYLLEP